MDYKDQDEKIEVDLAEKTGVWGMNGFAEEYVLLSKMIKDFLDLPIDDLESISEVSEAMINMMLEIPKPALKNIESEKSQNLIHKSAFLIQIYIVKGLYAILTTILRLINTYVTQNNEIAELFLTKYEEEDDYCLQSLMTVVENQTETEEIPYVQRFALTLSILSNASDNQIFITSIPIEFIFTVFDILFSFPLEYLSSDNILILNINKILYNKFKVQSIFSIEIPEKILSLFDKLAGQNFFEVDQIVFNFLNIIYEVSDDHPDIIHLYDRYNVYDILPAIPSNDDFDIFKFNILSTSLLNYDENSKDTSTLILQRNISQQIPFKFAYDRVTESHDPELLYSGLTLIINKLRVDQTLENIDIQSLCKLICNVLEETDLDTKNLACDLLFEMVKHTQLENYLIYYETGAIGSIVDNLSQMSKKFCKQCAEFLLKIRPKMEEINSSTPEMAKSIAENVDEIVDNIDTNQWSELDELADILTKTYEFPEES